MASTKTRSLVKGITWEVIGLLVLYFISQSITISIIYFAVRIVVFYIHERIWKQIRWGKKRNRAH